MTVQAIKPHELVGLLKKLRERDILLISEDTITAVMIYQNFHDLAREDKTLGNAMFFESRSCSIKFRSAPGVVHELRIRPSEDLGRHKLDGYAGDIVIHPCKGKTERAIIGRYPSARWLSKYILESEEENLCGD